MPTKIGIGPLKRAMQKKKAAALPSADHTEAETRTAKLLQRSLEKPAEESHENEGQLSVDVFETDDYLVIVAPIAGVEANDIDITVSDDIITIRGHREEPENTQSKTHHTQECFWGHFARTIILPQDVDTKKIRASFKKGILTIRIPRIEKRNSRVIRIQT